MDPSIMQLLEEDEDETMHSGADVDAFTAALNRDIEGDISTSQPTDSDLSVLSQGNSYTSNQFLHQWNPSAQMENGSSTSQQDTMVIQQMQTEPILSESDLQQQRAVVQSQKAPNESSQELHPFPPEHKSFQEDSHQPQSQQNVSHISQAAAMHDSGNFQVHNPGSDRMQLQQNASHHSQAAAMHDSGNVQVHNPGSDRVQSQQNAPHLSQAAAMHDSGNVQVHNTGSDRMQSQQNASHLSQAAAMQDSGNVQVHNPGSDRMQSQQIASNLSQASATNESGNVQVHNPGSDRMHSADYESQLMKLQNMNSQPVAMSRMGNQQTLATAAGMSNKQPILPGANSQQAMSTGNSNQLASGSALRGKQVPFGMLLPVIQPQLDKDRAMQLSTIYNKLRRNEIPKEDFVRHMKSIVGDQMLKMAVYKLQSQAARNAQNMPQLSSHSQAPAQQWQLPTTSDGNTNASKPCDIVERVPGAQVTMPAYGSSLSNYQPFSGQNANDSASPLKPGPQDAQTRHVPAYQNMSTASQLGMTTHGMNVANMPKFDRQNTFGDPKRLQGSSPHMTNSSLAQNSVQWQSSSSKEQKSGASSSMTYVKQEPFDQPSELHRPHVSAAYGSIMTPSSSVQAAQGNSIPGNLKDESADVLYSRTGFSTSALTSNLKPSTISSQADTINLLNSRVTPSASPVALGNNAKASSKKPSVGQKKPLEVLGSSPPAPSKKQKVSGAFLDQSIEQLNDVTAVSGVDLREEEEQLFSGPKEDSRISEASRRVVQEEEERLILEKVPFQKMLAEIMAKSGLKGISNDVERCLSLCVEERIRGLIGNLIRVSKQRLDIEKPRHKTIVTSDVGEQIMLMNKKAKVEWEKKQAEAEKLQKLNELPEGNPGEDGDKDKDEGRSRMAKVNKEEDDKMRTTAANVAARAAVGGDDMLSKWQLMAEQARQKREGDAASSSQPEKDIERKLASSTSSKDNQQADKKGQSTVTSTSGTAKKVGKSQAVVPHPKVARSISVKDVIAVLEREPQMSRSTLIYRLYEKIRTEFAAAE